MIKRIIFDVDNTLIDWKDEYIFALKNTLDKINFLYNDEQLKMIDDAVVEYEKHHDKYKLDDFVDYVNKMCKVNLPIEFASVLIEEQGNCWEENEKLVDTIKFLSTKYDLVVLSNWFTETQKIRLDKIGILKYFSLVSGGDEHFLKPNTKAFDVVLEGYKPSECVMVGDSLKHDILPALELGIRTIWVTKEKSDRFETIDNIHELKNML